MSYIQKIKNLFFTEADQGIRYPDEENRMLSIENNIINGGARSQTLMSNPIFQEAVTEIYLTLEAQLDMIEDTAEGSDEAVRWIRLQRRALRQICALLDNKIATMENVQKSKLESTEE